MRNHVCGQKYRNIYMYCGVIDTVVDVLFLLGFFPQMLLQKFGGLGS